MKVAPRGVVKDLLAFEDSRDRGQEMVQDRFSTIHIHKDTNTIQQIQSY